VNGYGVMVYADGDRHAGQFVEDQPQGKTEQQSRQASSSSDSSGQLIAGLIGSAIIGSARGIPSVDKARLISGFVQDVATDGRAGGIQAAAADIRAARAQSAAVQQAMAEPQQRAEQDRRDSERLAQGASRKREEDQRLAAEAQAKIEFLALMRSGTRLHARKCPGGEGKYHVVGLFPKVKPKPKPISCLDVHFRAMCPGNVVGSTGVGKNFLGVATDCFMGDAVTIDPKPACKVEDVSVRITDIRGCGE
jgi:hypothetical protein